MISENDIHMGSKTLNEVLLRVYWNDCALIGYVCGVMPSSDPFTVTSMKSLVCVNLLLQFKTLLRFESANSDGMGTWISLERKRSIEKDKSSLTNVHCGDAQTGMNAFLRI